MPSTSSTAKRNHRLALIASAWMVLCGGCDVKPVARNGSEEVGATSANDQTDFRSLTGNPFQQLAAPAPLVLTPAEGAAVDYLLALSRSGVAPRRLSQALRQLSLRKGALPIALMPPVRSAIVDNQTLKSLSQNTTGIAGAIGGALIRNFATNEALETQARQTILGLIKPFTKNSAVEGLPFSFSGFPSLGEGSTSGFKLEDQVARWTAAFAANGLFPTADATTGVVDPGLQALTLVQAMVEWQYLAGAAKGPGGKPAGGLSLKIDGERTALAGAYDPRSDPDTLRFYSGAYSVKVATGTDLDLARSGHEIWSSDGASLTLREQAELWEVAAIALHRLRPANRQALAPLFGNFLSTQAGDGRLPKDAHLLPLVFIASVKGLLPGYFIDEEARTIHDQGALSRAAPPTPASLIGLLRLASSLNALQHELADVSDLGLDASIASGLQAATDKLQPALQLAAQKVLEHLVRAPASAAGLVLRETDGSEVSAELYGETISTLIALAQGPLKSPELDHRIDGLAQGYAAQVLLPALSGKAPALSATASLWGLTALIAYQRLGRGADWLTGALSQLQWLVANFDQRSAP